MDWLEYHEEPVTLHSGGKSHWLVRGDLIFADPKLCEAVLGYWIDVLKTWSPPFEIVPVPRGGNIWAEILQAELATQDRMRPLREGDTPYRVIVDDVVTTGASIADPKAHIRLVVVDRRTPESTFDPYVNAWARITLPCLSMQIT